MSQKPEQTILKLLTRDGGVSVTFGALLTGEQYNQLLEFTRTAETEGEMRSLLVNLASEWGIPAIVEDA